MQVGSVTASVIRHDAHAHSSDRMAIWVALELRTGDSIGLLSFTGASSMHFLVFGVLAAFM